MKKSFLVRTMIPVASLLLQLSALCLQSHGAAGDVDLSFDPGSGVNGTVNAVVLQPDGKVLIGGQFTTVKGLLRLNVARLNADGSGDPTFDPSAVNPHYVVSSLALQPDGKVLVAGQSFPIPFCDESGCSEYHVPVVVRLHADGSFDGDFHPSTAGGADDGGLHTSLAVQSDGKVLVGGYFLDWDGTSRRGIARLNANGSLDGSFQPGAEFGDYPVRVRSVVAQSDGKVLICGDFTFFGVTNRNSLARLSANGNLDSSFDPGFGTVRYLDCGQPLVCSVVSTASAAALQPDGKVLVGVRTEFSQCDPFEGGCFNSISFGVIRLNANGSSDPGFTFTNVVNNSALLGYVKSIAVQPDGKVVVGSSAFNTVRIARLNADGSWDNSFNPPIGPGGGVNAVALQPDGKVLIGGDFTSANGTNRNRMARLNPNGSLDDSFHPGKDQVAPGFLLVQPDGKVVVGAVRLNADGSLDSTYIQSPYSNSFPADLGFPPDYDFTDSIATTTCSAVQPDGKHLIGGYFACTFVDWDGGITRWTQYFLKRFNADASRDTNFVQVIGYPEFGMMDAWWPMSLALQPDGKALFNPRRALVRFNPNGTPDASFNPVPGYVFSFKVQADGKIFIAGSFVFVNEQRGIARLNANGSLDTSFNSGTGASQSVGVFVFQPDGKVLIGGDFTTINGTNRNRIARLNANGSLDLGFNPGTGADGTVRFIAPQPDGNILISGDFLTVDGVLRPHVARLYGDSPWPSLNITRSNTSVIVSWPQSATGFVLEQSLTTSGVWSQVSFSYATNVSGISVSVPALTGNRFYRLRKL